MNVSKRVAQRFLEGIRLPMIDRPWTLENLQAEIDRLMTQPNNPLAGFTVKVECVCDEGGSTVAVIDVDT